MIKLTIEENLTKFLDTEIVRHNSAIINKVYMPEDEKKERKENYL